MSKKQVFGTREWADHTVDICSGCPNGCHYCYAKGEAIRFKGKTADTWTDEHASDRSFKKLETVCRKPPGKVMFPAHHDITLGNLDVCMDAIGRILGAGHELLIVSKPKMGCIAQICQDWSHAINQILFRFTIGS